MRILFLLLFLCLGGVASAQVGFDQRLLAKFNQDQLNSLKVSNPEILAYWNFYLDHSFVIIDMPAEKDFETIKTLKVSDVNNINILELHLTMDRLHAQLFKIEGSNKLLRLLSNDAFAKEFNVHRGLHNQSDIKK